MTEFQRSILDEQSACLSLANQGQTISEISRTLSLTRHQVRRRLQGARKREKLDPEISARLEAQGISDYAGLHSGWLIQKDKEGTGQSLYFYLGPDEEKLSFVDALMDVLTEIPKLEPIPPAQKPYLGKDHANWIALADLHVGGDYGDAVLERDFRWAVDDLVGRLPPAEHAVLFELGDVLEANDHKGITPHSGNMLEVRREDHLKNTMTAIALIRWALIRLLETHQTVEAHFIKGNHDPSAYVAVMLALKEHFKDNPRINIVVSDVEFRVVTWGKCAAFPHHGDTLKWEALKDVFSDMFADEWAAAKAHRIIMTAHFHHDRKRDLVGCVAEHYRTLHKPNGWAKSKGLLSRGSLTAMTVHKERGEVHRTISNILSQMETTDE